MAGTSKHKTVIIYETENGSRLTFETLWFNHTHIDQSSFTNEIGSLTNLIEMFEMFIGSLLN